MLLTIEDSDTGARHMSAAAFPGETSAAYPGWRVLLAAVIGLAFSPGPMIFGSLGLFAPHLAQDFGWNRGSIMLSLTFFNVAGVLASPFTGALIDRIGVRRVLFPSLVVLLLGFVAFSAIGGSLPLFYALAFVWGGLTVGTQSISYTKLITGWFLRRRGLAVGIAAAGLGLGYTLVPLIVGRLLAHMDWRHAMLALAGLIIVLPILVNALLSRPNPAVRVVGGTDQTGMSVKQARATPAFRYMAAAIFFASAALTGVVPHISLLALDRGMTTGQAASIAATYGLSTIIGRVIVGALADSFFVPRVAMTFFGLSGIGFVLAAVLGGSGSVGVLMLVALTIGLGFGAESDVIALFITRYFGQRCFGAIYGLLLAVFLVGASVGPALFGYGHDLAGGYGAPMLVGAVVMGLACLMLAQLGAYPTAFTDDPHTAPLAPRTVG